jgi:elongation factor G
MEFPEPVIEVAVEPKSKADQEKMGVALNRLVQEDSSFRVSFDPGSGQTIIKGMSELHLEIIVDRMRREFKVAANVGAPQVAYRESITKKIEWECTYNKHTGPAWPYAKVKIRFEPSAPASGFVFANAARDEMVPKEYVVGVEKGLMAAKETGVIAGFPVIDLKCTLIDGAYHEVESNVMTFDIAARACFFEAIPKAGPRLLEPMMKVEVVTPQEYMGDLIGDLNSRHGQVQGMDSRGNAQVITAMVPLASLFGYVSTLRSMTESRAQCTMRFDHYEQVPPGSPDGDDNFPMAAALRA